MGSVGGGMYGMSCGLTYDRQPYEAYSKHRELFSVSYERDQGHKL